MKIAHIPGIGGNRTDLIHNELFDLSNGFLKTNKKLLFILPY